MILILYNYADICTALLKASTGCIEKGRGSNNEHMVPGWNDSVTDLHAEARDAYVCVCHLFVQQ